MNQHHKMKRQTDKHTNPNLFTGLIRKAKYYIEHQYNVLPLTGSKHWKSSRAISK